jgi:protocatechuate 3,4-dioxygenase beta subunit
MRRVVNMALGWWGSALPLAFLLVGTLAAQTGAIHGSVKDTNGVPAAGISVTVFPVVSTGNRTITMANGVAVTSISTDTDDDGNYSFADLAPGAYALKAERATSMRDVTLDAGGEATVNFAIPASLAISGRVLNENKEPVANASVYLFTAEIGIGTLHQLAIGPKATKEDGSYTFDARLDVDRRYYVMVDRPPPDDLVSAAPDSPSREPIEVPTYYPSSTRMEGAIPIILHPGEHARADIKIARVPYYCVEGKVRNAGKPAAVDFGIFETPPDGIRQARLRTSSGDDGNYRVCGLPSGSYRLAADKGFTDFTIANSDTARVDLSLDMANPQLQIEWEGAAADTDLSKLNAQALETLRGVAGLLGVGSSDEELKSVATRVLRVDLFDAPMRAILPRLIGDSNPQSEYRKLMAALLPLNTNVNVTLIGTSGGFNGNLRNAVPAGDYLLHVESPMDTYAKEVTFNGAKLVDEAISLAPGSTGTLHLLMARGMASLQVSVADSEGKPLPNANVIVVPEGVSTVVALARSRHLGQCDAGGNFTASIVPGKYRVLATAQTVRWDVPEDVEKVLLVMFQGKEVELDAKAPAHITVGPVQIF